MYMGGSHSQRCWEVTGAHASWYIHCRGRRHIAGREKTYRLPAVSPTLQPAPLHPLFTHQTIQPGEQLPPASLQYCVKTNPEVKGFSPPRRMRSLQFLLRLRTWILSLEMASIQSCRPARRQDLVHAHSEITISENWL